MSRPMTPFGKQMRELDVGQHVECNLTQLELLLKVFRDLGRRASREKVGQDEWRVTRVA
jgi:hypothetical protein